MNQGKSEGAALDLAPDYRQKQRRRPRWKRIAENAFGVALGIGFYVVVLDLLLRKVRTDEALITYYRPLAPGFSYVAALALALTVPVALVLGLVLRLVMRLRGYEE